MTRRWKSWRFEKGNAEISLRVLVVSPLLPYPVRTGGALRIWQLLRALALEHDVTLLASTPPAVQWDEACEALAPVRLLRVPSAWTPGEGPTLAKRVRQLRSLFSRRSAFYWTFARPLAPVVRKLGEHTFDVVQVEYGPLGLLPFSPEMPLVLDAHNVEYRALERIAGQAPVWRRLWLRLETARVRRDERAAWRRATWCLATSRVDAQEIEAVSETRVAIVPNGVELDRYPLQPPERAEPDHVLFVGSFRYWPNVDGIRWFAEQVWPRIVRCRPTARLSLVGFDPPAEVRRLERIPGVVVVGTVPDVRPWLARASVVVVPLRAGSGTRLKLLEALAAGKAVVSTRLGAEGVECEHGRHLLLADEPQAFAESVLSLLASPEQRRALGRAGRQLVEEEYAWERIAEKLLAVYRRLASENGGSGT